MKTAGVISLLAALALGAAPRLSAERMYSSNFADVNGMLGFASAAGVSPNFAGSASLQELAVSSQEVSGLSQRAGRLAFHPFPSTVADLSVVIVSSHSIKVAWSAPSADVARPGEPVDSYMLKYTETAPISDDAAFKAAPAYVSTFTWVPLPPGGGEVQVVEGFNPGTTYYFSLESLNSHRLRSEFSNSAIARALVPLPPMNFKITRAGLAVNMTWIPPAGYMNRIPFNDRFSPTFPYEITGYQVFKATAPADAEWQFIAEVSSDVFNWTDSVGANDVYYYHARAVNKAGVSLPSYARDSNSGDLYFLAPDNQSILHVPADGTGSFFTSSSDPLDSYNVEISTHPEDLAGRVVKSVEFAAYKGGLRADPSFKLSRNGMLKLYYSKAGGAIVPSAQTDEKSLSMYYDNGSRWLQMYGVVDAAERSVRLETTRLGRYQLRTTMRTGSFSADRSGLTNRLITPNNDGKNDNMVFIFDNPQEKAVKGRIFDMRGALVGQMAEGPVANSLKWDAKAGGQPVPGGVYIYQIEADGTVYNGTVAVIR
jgi:gliding motility-associated-like protein